MRIREERLTERILRLERDPERVIDSDPAVLVRSILDHLRRILNTRQGSTPIAPDYGAPDFTGLASTFGLDSVPEIERGIREVVGKYEPRLSKVKATYDPKTDAPLSLPFRIEGSIRYKERDLPVVFETILDPDGRIKVSS